MECGLYYAVDERAWSWWPGNQKRNELGQGAPFSGV